MEELCDVISRIYSILVPAILYPTLRLTTDKTYVEHDVQDHQARYFRICSITKFWTVLYYYSMLIIYNNYVDIMPWYQLTGRLIAYYSSVSAPVPG